MSNQFEIMDREDERRIMNSAEMLQSLAYEVKGIKALSYAGIKFLLQEYIKEYKISIEMVPAGTTCNLEKDDPSNMDMWYWRAQCCIRMITNDGDKPQITESIGQSESTYLTSQGKDQYGKPLPKKYDPFGKTKALSKAERNAYRKQLPEARIANMLNKVDAKNVQVLNVDSSSETTSDFPTANQLRYLSDLKYSGPEPKTKQEASVIIDQLKSGNGNTCECKIPKTNTKGICLSCKKAIKKVLV